MNLSILFRNWGALLIQGILLIAISIVMFNNPDAVLAAAALYLGVIVLLTGLIGVIANLTNSTEDRDIFTLLGSAVIAIIGLLMLSNMFVTIKAITMLFGLLVSVVGWILLWGGWTGKKQWSLWWIIAVLGAGALITGIESIMDIAAGAESISTFLGTAVLIAGIGLVCLALLKKKLVVAIKSRL